MAVYYKFKSARDYDSVALDGPFISVGALKEKIFESKHLGRGTDFDLLVTNAQTNEEYLDEAMLIPKNTSVLIRRVPGRPRMAIVTEQEPKAEIIEDDVQSGKGSLVGPDSSSMKYQEDTEWDEFGNDLYAIPEVLPVQSSSLIPEVAPITKADEENKLKALINTPALDWQRQGADGFGAGRGSGRGMNGRMGLRGFGMERKTPPQGYVCHRCNVPGHFIQHCPTNGDPTFDIKRVKPPTGIPKSMLMATPDGSYALPSGVVATLKPNEAAFEKEIEGLPSTRSVGELPPELHCPLCKEVMKDAVLTSKCCFNSFCDRCIRDRIISKSVCVCGATNILADDLLPNKTLRDTINRILESGNSSTENAGSAFQVQDMESARDPQPKIPSPTLSSASKGNQQPPSPKVEETQNVKVAANEVKASSAPPQIPDKGRNVKVPDVSEATRESMSLRELTSQGSALQADEEVQQKVASGEAAKLKKKKKVRVTANDMQWRNPQDLAAENYMMSVGRSSYNPYWNGMQPGMDSFMGPYANGMPYNMAYGMGPLDMPFGMIPPQDPFAAQPYMNMPPMHPQRDLTPFGMGGMGMNMNARPTPIMSREEFEARKADVRRKRENESRGERREFPRDRDYGRNTSCAGDGSSMNFKRSTVNVPPGDPNHHQHRPRSERASPVRSRDTHEPSRARSRDNLEPSHRGTKRRSSERRDLDGDRGDRDRDLDRDRGDRDLDRDRGDRDYYDSHRDRHSSRPEPSKRPPSSDPAKPALSSSAAAAAAAAAAALDRKNKASVFSRISFPENEPTKKRKVSSSSSAEAPPASASGSHHKASASNGHYDDHKSSSAKPVSASASGAGGRKASSSQMDYESSDDERHFKRKPPRYEPSPPPRPAEWEEEEAWPSHSSRERDRERDRSSGRHSKHR